MRFTEVVCLLGKLTTPPEAMIFAYGTSLEWENKKRSLSSPDKLLTSFRIDGAIP